MARQRKHPRSEKLDGAGDGVMETVKRITRSLSRKMKDEPASDESKTSSSQATTSSTESPRAASFLSTLVAHPEVFFDRFVPFLPTSSLADLCEAMETHARARELLQNTQQWRYISERDELLGHGAWNSVTRTVEVPGACPELSDYLSMRSQRECFDENVIVTAGDLEFITVINGAKVDCLAFPTSSAFYNPRSGVSGCVHRRAGPGLDRHIASIRNPPRGMLTTPGFAAGVKLLIHCTGPAGTSPNRQTLLYDAYIRALRVVETAEDIECAAFASISTGLLRYPVDEAARTAMAAVRDMMRSRKWPEGKKIAFVCVDKRVLQAFIAAREEVWNSFTTADPLFPDILAGSLV